MADHKTRRSFGGVEGRQWLDDRKHGEECRHDADDKLTEQLLGESGFTQALFEQLETLRVTDV
jgi:hypothetical protein